MGEAPGPLLEVRDFTAADRAAVNRIALAAWREFAEVFESFDGLAARLANLAALSTEISLIVAESGDALVGVVGYVPPDGPREPMFPREWALVRLLSVAPEARGRGIGRRLTEECIDRARRDGAVAIGLHTSPAMKVALPLYLKLGFRHETALPPRYGVPYDLYRLAL